MTETVTIKGTCAECRRPVERLLERPSYAPMARLLEQQSRGESPIWCDDCAEEDFDAARAAEQATRRRTRRLERAGLPAAYSGLGWEDLERGGREEALVELRAWAEGTLTSRGILLWGPVGRGKTRMAAVAAQEMIHRRRVRWINVATLMADLRAGYGTRAQERAARLLEGPGELDALILDDLDKVRPRDQDAQPLYVLVNAIVEGEHPLLVTLNDTLEGLADRLGEFGEPIASRLAGYCHGFEVSGRDRRLQP